MMRKLKIYLDTSVISHLDAPDAPEKMADTKKLWEDFEKGNFDIIISDVTLSELYRCAEPKLSNLLYMLRKISYTDINQTDEAEQLSLLYFEKGGLPPKSKEDAMHIAIATVTGCNVILSWNFKHIVNLRAMTVVDAINLKEGYSLLRILSPTMLLGSEE